MRAPEPKPIRKHLDFTPGEAATAKDEVAEMLASPGWKRLTASIEDYMRFEQRELMMPTSIGSDSARYERAIGQWSGLRMVQAIAEGIVVEGQEAERKMRAAEAA